MSKAEILDTLRNEGLVTEAELASTLDIQRYEQLALLAWDFPEAVEHVAVTQMTTIAIGHSSTSFIAVTGGGNKVPSLMQYSMGAAPPPSSAAAGGRRGRSRSPTAGPTTTLSSVKHDLPNWPVRHQGKRGTCAAHAAVALIEHNVFHQRPHEPIDASEQYAYWAAKNFDPAPMVDGTRLEYVAMGVNAHGYVPEWAWPYVGGHGPGSATVGGPPPNVTSTPTQLNYVPRSPGSGNAAAVHAALVNGPVAAAVPVYGYPGRPTNNWINRTAQLYGIIQNPIEKPKAMLPVDGHAVALVGFLPDATEPLGGYFVFRNSWGPHWANLAHTTGGHVWRTGYGQLSATYVEKYVWEWCHI